MKVLQPKYKFFLLFFSAFLPLIGTFLILVLSWNQFEEKESNFLWLKQNFALELIRNKDNIAVHHLCKHSDINFFKNIAPIKYNEVEVTKYPLFKEIQLKQTEEKFLSISDLRNFIQKLSEPASTQNILIDFTLERNTHIDKEDNFKTNSKLIKREFE